MPDKKSLEALKLQPAGGGMIDLICPRELCVRPGEHYPWPL